MKLSRDKKTVASEGTDHLSETSASTSSGAPPELLPARSLQLGPKPGDEHAWIFGALFDVNHYRRISGVASDEPGVLFQHYLDIGMATDLSPSPLFDPLHVYQTLQSDSRDQQPSGEADGSDSQEFPEPATSSMQLWLADGIGRVTPNSWFDAHFYRNTYRDIGTSNLNPFLHFAAAGLKENRSPCELIHNIRHEVSSHFSTQIYTVSQLLSSIPPIALADLLSDSRSSRLQQSFTPELYRSTLSVDLELPMDTLIAHFLWGGWCEGHRPSALFHQNWYKHAVESCDELEPVGSLSPFLHWLYLGDEANIVPTPFFDATHYLTRHEDIRRSKLYGHKPFMHFQNNGVKERNRSGSTYFDNNYYVSVAGSIEHESFITDYLIRGQYLGFSPSAEVDPSMVETKRRIDTSPVEEIAMKVAKNFSRLESGPLADVIARCEQLEPQIVRPYGHCKIRLPPMIHPATQAAIVGRDLTRELRRSQYDTVVLIPHCRMAGSAKVSGTFVSAMGNLTDPENVLVITTDLNVFERAEWFPEGVDLLDLSSHVAAMKTEGRVLALLDLVRGLRPKRMININSNLGWHLTRQYGEPLSEWMNLYVYLFCWDLDIKGKKGGYPIQWFLPTFDHCTLVITDNEALRDELRQRYAPSAALASKIITLYQPATDTHVSYRNSIMERSANGGRSRVFWCGRFDRQKRPDLLVGIADAMPDIEFVVWGKRVMHDGADELANIPANIKLMGEFSHFDDMSIGSCDCFLYTSSWDGLPIVLIEIGSRSVPIVASDVGGVSELVDDTTGWLVRDVENIDAYVESIREVLSNNDAAMSKAALLRERTIAQCSHERYEADLAVVIDREPKCDDTGRVYDAHTDIVNLKEYERSSKDTKPDITAVLTAHAEGALAAVSLQSFLDACHQAEASGVRVERLVILDNPKQQTLRVFEGLGDELSIHHTSFGDQGLVRNFAVTLARGEFMAFLDGDDLWGDNWLSEACRFLQSGPTNVIAHPEFNRFFSGVSSIFTHIDQEDPSFQIDFLRHANYWDAMCMARRSTHQEFPYCKRRVSEGFALEDWHWNCQTVMGGQIHKIIPDTIHFKRRREGSQTMQVSRNRSLMPSTLLTSFARPDVAKVKVKVKADNVDLTEVSVVTDIETASRAGSSAH